MSQTQQNLLKAFAGESQARNKYTQFAKIARKQDQEFIARVFEETAENERVHAGELFELITEPVMTAGDLTITPFSHSTVENLREAAKGENYEWTEMYPNFETIAQTERESEPARLFGKLKEVEKLHEERYIILATKLDNDTLYNSETELEWKCLNCGYIHKGKTPPTKCPLCQKPFSWYMPIGLIK
ncbi:MAG TPA: ferritin family protein [Candidatus Woesebacteria bacterium]|nr:ferritin family protein [Candidatus Woesebacteria bacterium]HRS22605.1 ferritin family protein [Candidatus Woesebacteria bacterium]HRT40054.1 ferritin family protein [Candidatus Woesebacteria bacterium]